VEDPVVVDLAAVLVTTTSLAESVLNAPVLKLKPVLDGKLSV
jgi:hypothetical protein